MRVLEIIGSVDPRHGGPVEGVIRQAVARRQFGLETSIVTLDPPNEPWLRDIPVPIVALGRSGGAGSSRLPWRRYGLGSTMVPWLRQNLCEHDVAVVNGLWNYAVCAARRTLIDSGVPYVVFAHGMLDPWLLHRHPVKHAAKRLSFALIEKPLLDRARAVLFATEDERNRARAGDWRFAAPDRIVGYGTAEPDGDPAAQVEAFGRLIPALRERRFLLFLGRLHPIKGCDLLVEAFARVAAQRRDVDLVIAGPDPVGWRTELQRRAAALGLAERIHWLGMLTGDAKLGALRSCDAMVLPSHSESFGMVVAEALAAAAPVLITDKVPLWRDVAADGAGLADSDDVDGVHRVLEAFLSAPPERIGRMRGAARACFLRRYEISIATRRYTDALRDAARGTAETGRPAPVMAMKC
ncbi:glycosyltransferase [Rhodoplanes azumiensis]|uniref:Glycosyltransferase n=1 Tax=Rhodoplanes azumiensis TaxID=1897628 RepID=A0ABW5ANM0_9BRAD